MTRPGTSPEQEPAPLGPGAAIALAPTVSALGEDALVARVIAGFGASTAPGWLTVGPGDDAAVFGPVMLAGGSLVASTDTLVQGEDFRLDWSGPADVGVKVAAQNFADIAAMGATPRVLLVSLAIPGAADPGWAQELAAGLALECARAGAVVAGGDVSQADQIVITGTALGVLAPGQQAVLRSGARPGDVLAIAGQVGRSGAGLSLLQNGFRASTADAAMAGLIADHQRAQPPYAAGPRAAAAGAVALIDTSDGLVRDAARIAAASGVVLDLDAAVLTPSADLVAAGRLLHADPLGWVLTGGEDHALLACFPGGAVLPEGFVRIGRVLAADAGEAAGMTSGTAAGSAAGAAAGMLAGSVLVDGRPWTGDPGWRHFGPA